MPLGQQQLVGLGAELPPGRDVAARRLAGELSDHLDALVEDRLFLLGRHGDRVLVAVAVHADLVAGLGDRPHLLGEGLDRVTGTNQVVLIPKRSNRRRRRGEPTSPENMPREMSQGRILAAIGAKPAADRIDVDAVRTEDFLCHRVPPRGVLSCSGPCAPRRGALQARGW